ncbi:MAG: RDD family protein [Gemmataceae bacterium]|nr:RDD family protein [Gemmataceae bacterium]
MILHEVVTTEKVPFTYRVAGIGSRFLAWLVDAGIILLFGFVGMMVANVLEGGREGLGIAVFLLAVFVLRWGYFLCFEWLWQGQTPGKRIVGIRVIQWRGTGISFYQSAARNFVRMIDGLPLVFLPGFFGFLAMLTCPPGLLGFLVAIGNEKQRRLGDWAAGTLVVHVERQAKPIQALHDGITESGPLSEVVVRQRLGQLTRPQKQTLLDLCLRRDQLRVSDRAQLFHATADYLKARFDLTPREHQSDEKFVVYLAGVLSSGTTGR